MLIRDNIPILTTSVGYLDCIDASATEISTIYHVMERCLKIKESLNIQSVVCVFDQAIYCKAVEIKWKDPEKFASCVIMLGIFHTLMMYLGIIGKRFRDAGLRDLLIQSEVLAEGSIDRALNGKMYNRAVRYVKLIYEALSRILLENFNSELENDTEKMKVKEEVMKKVGELNNDLCQEQFKDFVSLECFSTYTNMFTDFMDNLNENGGDLAKFWLSFIDMAKILLNLLYATRAGMWDLLLETVRDIIPYTFAYDNIHYSRYLMAMFGEMLMLETKNPEIYNEFKRGNFTAQLSQHNSFGRMEPDKVIEMTINKDTKTPGGTTGFSTNINAINRWTLNAAYRAGLKKCLSGYINYSPKDYCHKDLTKSRIAKDERDVQSIKEIAQNLFINPFSHNALVCISNGLLATEAVTSDLLGALNKGHAAMEAFADERLSDHATVDFFQPIKKMNLKTFSNMKKIVKFTVKDKIVPMRAHSNLFGQLALIMQKRVVDLEEVFRYPLGPYPWSLSGVMGELRKTSKASLMHWLEKDVKAEDSVAGSYSTIIDGMAVVQKINTSSKTFGELSKQLLKTVLSLGKDSERIDMVFDVYRDESIKNAERVRRSSGNLLFKQIFEHQQIKQWNAFLSSAINKTALIKFLVEDWEKIAPQVLNEKVLFVAFEENCYCLSRHGKVEVVELQSNQEEADTRMLLHLKHANNTFNKFIIHTPDTDVMVLCLGHLSIIRGEVYIKTGVKEKTRFVNLQEIKKKFDVLADELKCDIEDLLKSFVSLHAFTGCDTVSSFVGKGKSKAYNQLIKSKEFVTTFMNIGCTWELNEVALKSMERFVCSLYGYNNDEDLNKLRYKIYCSKRGKISCVDLPPCHSAFVEHCKRTNYQARIWRLATIPRSNIPSPINHGWKYELNEDGNEYLVIKWMSCNPAPDEILELLACNCRRKCIVGSCSCIDAGLNCTEACTFKDCENMQIDDDENEQDYYESDDDDDDDNLLN